MSWFESNAVTVVGWVGTLVAFAFVFGRRLSRLEDTDAHLTKTVEALSVALRELQKTLEGVNGHRVQKHEQEIQMHEVRLAKLEQGLDTLEAGVSRIEARQVEVAAEVRSMSSILGRIDTRCSMFHKPEGKP